MTLYGQAGEGKGGHGKDGHGKTGYRKAEQERVDAESAGLTLNTGSGHEAPLDPDVVRAPSRAAWERPSREGKPEVRPIPEKRGPSVTGNLQLLPGAEACGSWR